MASFNSAQCSLTLPPWVILHLVGKDSYQVQYLATPQLLLV